MMQYTVILTSGDTGTLMTVVEAGTLLSAMAQAQHQAADLLKERAPHKTPADFKPLYVFLGNITPSLDYKNTYVQTDAPPKNPPSIFEQTGFKPPVPDVFYKDDPRGKEYGLFKAYTHDGGVTVSKLDPDGVTPLWFANFTSEGAFRAWAEDCT